MLTRAISSELLIRSDGDGRTVHGLLAPFGKPTKVSDAQGSYTETLTRGSFAPLHRSQVGRIKLLKHHDRRSDPLGKAVEVAETDHGLEGAFRISATRAGDEALELIRDGAFDAFSIGAQYGTDDEWNRSRTSVIRRGMRLQEVSLVNFPAYEGARVAGVRSAEAPVLTIPEARLRLALALSKGTPR